MIDILTILPDKVSPEPNSGCWLWTGARAGDYGQTHHAGRHMLAHRRSYELSCGPIPQRMNVLHRCDNKSCVNPDHLEVGTQKKNMQDAILRGRQRVRRGSMHSMAVLSELQVEEIQKLAQSPQPRGFWLRLARDYGVDKSTVSAVKLGKTWL